MSGSPAIEYSAMASGNELAFLGVADLKTGLTLVMQVPLAQMERLLDQLSSLSAYANHLFLDIGNQTVHLQSRLEKLTLTVEAFHENIPKEPPLLEAVAISNYYFYNRDWMEW